LDFFERQERARRTTRFLVVAFALSFAAVALATTALVAFVVRFYMADQSSFEQSFGEWAAAHAGLLSAVALATLAVMTLASVYRAVTLSDGGAEVARMLGGSEVSSDTTDFARKRLLNVVEEMAIASGLPMPDVFVLEREHGINAFAAGLSPSDAAIAVTRGALEQLDRAELQGVIAHEVGHILNGDMRLNHRLIGFSFGILVLSLLGRALMRPSPGRRSRGRSGDLPVMLFGLALYLIGSIGLLASRLIKAAVSRERERLADASAVQFTRDPSSLAAALKKIAAIGSRLTWADSEEIAHMLFEHRRRGLGGLFATHPPLVERIRALEPHFDPKELVRLRVALDAAHAPRTTPAGTSASSHEQAPTLALSLRQLADDTMVADGSPLEHAGELGSPELGAALREDLPAEIYDAAHSRESSLLLVLALALSADPVVLAAQRGLLEAQLGARRAARCEALRAELERLDPTLRLPLLELALPALKQRPPSELEYLFELAGKIAALNPRPRLFDHLLLRMLAAQLAAFPGRRAAPTTPKLSTQAACATLLAVVAAYGHDDADAAMAAYRAGAARIGNLPMPADRIESLRDASRLDAPLARLAALGPRDKRKVLDAVLAAIRHDTRIGLEELELLRVIAAALGCPLPWGAGLVRRRSGGEREADSERRAANLS